MKTICILFILALTFLGSRNECKTTFVVTDCNNEGVPGATVTVSMCKDNQTKSLSTNVSGKAVFTICKKDICKIKITAVGFEPTLASDCSGPADNTTCKVKICKDDK
ncbi:MAG: hypothetical protein JWQ79_3175 [Mucilaginibacter sp.]|nr:hypothetical protein [Mucilaginibacter sp.]